MFIKHSDQPDTPLSIFELGSLNTQSTGSPPIGGSGVADIAHDLNNLVTGFKTRLYIAQKTPALYSEHFITLENLVNQLDSLVQDLVEVSQNNFGSSISNPTLLNLNDLVKGEIRSYESLASCKGVNLFFDAAILPPILADELDINRVVANLLCNALNYTPDGGSVVLSTDHIKDSVQLTIHDTGIGIEPEAIAHIFERGYRAEEAKTQAQGTGLGLAIVLGIVENYGGTIEVESTFGRGTTFRVTFPAYSSA